MKLVIKGTLPGMNEIIAAAKVKYGKYKEYRDMKNTNTDLVAWECRSQLPRDYKINKCVLNITYYCKDERRDKDNIAAAKKFILDGMQKAGVIANDGWEEIEGWNERFYVDKNDPRIEINIKEI